MAKSGTKQKRLRGRPVMKAPLLRLYVARELCRTQSIKAAAHTCGVSCATARKILLEDIEVIWRIKAVETSESGEVQGYLPL